MKRRAVLYCRVAHETTAEFELDRQIKICSELFVV